MLSLVKWVIVKYITLVVRMNDDMNVMATTKKNLGCLFDIEVVMGLTCIMPLLEVVYVFIKLALEQNIFVCDFVTFFKICCVVLQRCILI
jgi:hypothetical protein